MLERLKSLLFPADALARELTVRSAFALAAKITAIGVSFGFNVIVARYLGAEGAGAFFLATAVAMIASTIGRLGLDNTVIRFVSGAVAADDGGRAHGAYVACIALSFTASLVFAAALAMMSGWVAATVFGESMPAEVLAAMAWAIVPYSVLTIAAEALKGLRRVVESLLVTGLLVPVVAGVLIFVMAPTRGVQGAVDAYVCGTALSCVIALGLWWVRARQLGGGPRRADVRGLMESAMPLLAVAILRLIPAWAPLLLVGTWVSTADAGLYSVAHRTALLTSMVLVAVNAVVASRFAAAHRRSEFGELERLALHSVRITTLAAAPVLAVFLVAPAAVLAIFGPEFRAGWPMLAIMALGQFVNVATGSVGNLLSMTGHERVLRNNVLVSSFLCLATCIALIPHYGAAGAAAATALTVATQNLLSVRSVWRHLGIRTLPQFFYGRAGSAAPPRSH